MDSYEFPDDFLWGTATAAHQVEGNNINSDWWHWERTKKASDKYPINPSNIACDSYNRYDEDFELCKKLNNNAVRISVEWARIQPKEDEVAQFEIDHYRDVIRAAKNKGLKVFLTLHHFTNPQWFAQKGGWQRIGAPSDFAKYVKICAQEFGDLVDVFITINEPQVYALMAYTLGYWPPQKINPIYSYLVQLNMIRAHRKAYKEIKKITDTPVGIAKNIVWYETDPEGSNAIDRLACNVLNFLNDDFYLRPIIGRLDFLGLNYYFTKRIRNLKFDNPTDYVTDTDEWINPGGLGNILTKLKKYNLPIYITENGLADWQDRYRAHYIKDMLIACGMAILNGVDVKGYFHWSLLDNFEWHLGYYPKYGLVEIDRVNDLERIPRASFYYYANVCKNKRVEV